MDIFMIQVHQYTLIQAYGYIYDTSVSVYPLTQVYEYPIYCVFFVFILDICI